LQTPTPKRVHLTRLLAIWRSAGWPCQDAVELDLVGAGWAAYRHDPAGRQTIHLTDAGVQLLAAARRRQQHALNDHDRLAARMAAHLSASGRVVWRELSLRAHVVGDAKGNTDAAPAPPLSTPLWPDAPEGQEVPHEAALGGAWRVARPDVFSVRRTSVEAYLQPMVHEVKVSRADLLSDLRHQAKRESYQWLSCEAYYVLADGVAQAQEIPPAFGVWQVTGSIDNGLLELVRPARHVACKLPFAVWMAMAQAAPVRLSPLTDPTDGQDDLQVAP
jgi:hypothetical protein